MCCLLNNITICIGYEARYLQGFLFESRMPEVYGMELQFSWILISNNYGEDLRCKIARMRELWMEQFEL